MGVKERKRAERDRDDSNFIYSKQKKKINEEPLSQPVAQTSATGFGTEQFQTLSQKSGN